MANEKGSDRERLLRLIDGDEAVFRDIAKKKKLSEAPRRVKEAALSFVKKAHELLRNVIKGGPAGASAPLFINRALVGLLAIMSLYLILDFLSATIFRNGIIMPFTGKYEKAESRSFSELSPLGYYTDPVSGKDIFDPKRISLPGIKVEVSSGEPYSGLRLVGIDWGDRPVAMIEDTQTSKTFFVQKGDSLKDAKVTDVLKDRVKLRLGNKSVELK